MSVSEEHTFPSACSLNWSRWMLKCCSGRKFVGCVVQLLGICAARCFQNKIFSLPWCSTAAPQYQHPHAVSVFYVTIHLPDVMLFSHNTIGGGLEKSVLGILNSHGLGQAPSTLAPTVAVTVQIPSNLSIQEMFVTCLTSISTWTSLVTQKMKAVGCSEILEQTKLIVWW